MRRFWLASGMNLLVPGTGLIIGGRAWLGVAVGVWFGLGAELAVCGAWIAPATIPAGLTVTGAAFAAAAWALGQALLVSRVRFLRSARRSGELEILRRLAEEAVGRADYPAARSALRVAMSIDDSDVAMRVLWARVLTATSSPRRARRAWRSVARMDAGQQFTPEVRHALERLETA